MLSAAPPGTTSSRIAVDQFGYMPEMAKVAVLSDPQAGFNATESYAPGATLQVRAWGTHAIVFSAAPVAWNGGATHLQSGDKVWWFDFSAVTKWGEYYIYDPTNDLHSDRFRVAHDVYREVLQQAVRVFFYQRRGGAKQPPFTDAKWADTASHLGPLQDPQCRLISDPTNAALTKDLRGGWFDAGDYNKYTNWTCGTLSDLLLAYEQNPLIWNDEYNLPESGNGIPDLLDEIKWELDWLLRMQNANGSVLSKVGVLGFQAASPPSADTAQMFYGAASTSATFATAATFAHAARVFSSIGQTSYATTLSTAAAAAWAWGVANPSVVFSNTGFSSVNPEVDAYGRSMFKLTAAIYLYALTGNATYKTYVEANYLTAQPMQWYYWYGFESTTQDALLYYSSLPGVTASVANEIRSRKQSSMGGSEFLPAFTGKTDAWRANLKDSDYVWGSNTVKGHVGTIFRQQLTYGLDAPNAANYRAAAGGFLNYFHGVNPLAMTYLTNMSAYGGDRCANEIYHSWFADGTPWDNALTSLKGPPPGYVTGGANPTYTPDSAYTGAPIVPPMSQPIQKSYKDWNTSYPQNSWQLTEPAIYSQAAYIQLLASFPRPLTYDDWKNGYALSAGQSTVDADANTDGVTNLEEFAFSLAPTGSNTKTIPTPSPQTHNVAGQNRRFLTVTFPRQLSTGDMTYIVQASGDLTTWTDVCSATGTAAPTGPGFVSQTGTGYQRTVTARDTVEGVRRFLRILVRKN